LRSYLFFLAKGSFSYVSIRKIIQDWPKADKVLKGRNLQSEGRRELFENRASETSDGFQIASKALGR
jgi:hypothetical protein